MSNTTVIEVGQRWIGDTGTVLAVTRIDRKADGTIARVIVRNEDDDYVGWHGDFVQQAADGDLKLVSVPVQVGQQFTNVTDGPAIVTVTEVHADGRVTATHAHLGKSITYPANSLQSQVRFGTLTEVTAPAQPSDNQVRIGDLKLADAQGRPVRFDTVYTGNGHASFTILRAVNGIAGTLPTLVVQFRGSAGTVERFAHNLFDGWHWISTTI